MKVAELIKQLKKLDVNTDVMVSADGDPMEINSIYIQDEDLSDDSGVLIRSGDVVISASL